MSRPIPSTLVVIPCMPIVPAYAKIRILGCVTSHDASNGKITLTHKVTSSALKTAMESYVSVYRREQLRLLELQEQHQQQQQHSGSNDRRKSRRKVPKVSLDLESVDVRIDNLVPNLPSLRPKEWVNVIGYKQDDGSLMAVMLWKVDSVDLVQYENSVAAVLNDRREDGRPLVEVRDR